jgi:hypothetical protein
MKKGRAAGPSRIKHEIFLEYAKKETSIFWKTILENCAFGQFPKGMSFRDGTIFYKKGRGKQPLTKYIPENIEEGKNFIIDFLRNDVGFHSRDEVTKQQLENRVRLAECLRPHDTVWKDIRAASTQRQIIANFISVQQEKLRLTEDEANQLYATIIVGLALGTLTGDDIEMDRGTILNIDNIVRLDNGYFTAKIAPIEPITFKPENKEVKQKSINDGWDKYIATYQKYMYKK